MESNDQSLRCMCSNGHKIRATRKHAGLSIDCPACGVPVTVPAPSPASITDTGALRIINEIESEFQETKPPAAPRFQPKAPARVEPICPRCRCTIKKSDQVCPECKLILASGSKGFKQVYLAALRSLR